MAKKWCENLSVFLLPKWLLTKLLSKAISWIVESSFTSYGTGVIIAGISGIITHMRILHLSEIISFFFYLSFLSLNIHESQNSMQWGRSFVNPLFYFRSS